MPGLWAQVGSDGTILSISGELALALGIKDPASVTGVPIATCLPDMAEGSPLNLEILEKGELHSAPVTLLAPSGRVRLTALLSARAVSGDGLSRGAWMGCFTRSTAEDQRTILRADFGRELLESLRIELLAQMELQTRQSSSGGAGDAPGGLGSTAQICLTTLPGLEALSQLDLPLNVQAFDVRTTVSDLCRTTGRIIGSAGASLLFDMDPACPARVRTDEHRLRVCLNLLLGFVYAKEKPAEMVVRLALEDADALSIEVAAWPAPEPALPGAGYGWTLGLCKSLALTADGTVSVDMGSPGCVRYALRLKATAEPESAMPLESGPGVGSTIDLSLKGLQVLLVGFGEAAKAILAKWLDRRQADYWFSSTGVDVSSANNLTAPDVAVFDLSVCQSRADRLRQLPVLGLRRARTPVPYWCSSSITAPIFEEDFVAAVGLLIQNPEASGLEQRGPAPQSAPQILAVDDNPINLRILQKTLVRLGCEVDLATNGREALDAIGGRLYDIVLMDWEMPVMDGLETTMAIRQLPEPACRIPIIAVTAHALPGDRETCLRAGMDDYLSKPVKVERLSAALDLWLRCSPRALNA